MNTKRFTTFAEFWPFYIGEHRHPLTRILHFVGTTCGLVAFAMAAKTGKLWLLPVGLVVSYGFAWFSHFFIEKNRPATFIYPGYSFIGDFRMYWLMWIGQMEVELARLEAAGKLAPLTTVTSATITAEAPNVETSTL
jgi:hypothetical protein